MNRFAICLALCTALASCHEERLQIACGTEQNVCVDAATHALRDALAYDASNCCGGYCVVLAAQCSSGLAYLTSEFYYGDCVPDSVCEVKADLAAPADLSNPADFSTQDGAPF
jgi:hypothetical protein